MADDTFAELRSTRLVSRRLAMDDEQAVRVHRCLAWRNLRSALPHRTTLANRLSDCRIMIAGPATTVRFYRYVLNLDPRPEQRPAFCKSGSVSVEPLSELPACFG
jgi:hypothetical protein